MSTHLEHNGGDETLDLGCLEALFLSFLLWKWTLDHVLSNIILLCQVEQLADLGGSLGSQSARNGHVGQSGDFLQAQIQIKVITILSTVLTTH